MLSKKIALIGPDVLSLNWSLYPFFINSVLNSFFQLSFIPFLKNSEWKEDDILIEEGHAYDYHGGKKKDFKKEIKEEKEKAKKSIKDI